MVHSIALVAMSHLAETNNMVNGFFGVFCFSTNAPRYWQQKRRVHVPDGCRTDSLEMRADMIRAMHSQHLTFTFPGMRPYKSISQKCVALLH